MRIVTFGEIMLRLSPEGYGRLFQSDRLIGSFGGAEANVAISLSQFGENAAFVTRLPDQAVGHGAIRTLRSFGVDTSPILFGGDRLGLYFQEKGVGVRDSLCIYDRAHSAFAQASLSDFDWDNLLAGADWFHFTGITPALSPALADICRQACLTARRLGVRVSCDLNYREKLWPLSAARPVMADLCSLVDVCIANEGEVHDLFDIQPDGTGPAYYQAMAREACARFGFSQIALTLFDPLSSSEDTWSGLLYDRQAVAFAPTYHLPLIDRVGIGDSFGAGLIYALGHRYDRQAAIDFAVAASALKHTVEGDFNRVSVEEVRRLAGKHRKA
jgi:2-dehydro-3-deoxygluconokinase